VCAETSPTAVPAGIRRSTVYLPELESLRGIAIALVLVFHADAASTFPFVSRVGAWPSPALAYVWSGHTGVTLFFILSGFLLSLPFLEEAYGGRRVSRPQFYARRALRILPLYYAAIVAATVITSRTVGELERGVPYLAFLESKPDLVTPMPPFSGVWWSLATEAQFYVLLPLIALAFGRSRRTTLLVLAAYLVVYVGIASHRLGRGIDPWFRAQSVIGRGPLFLLGILAAWLWLRHGAAVRARLAASRWLVFGGADVVLLAVLVALGYLLRWVTFRGFLSLEVTGESLWHVPEGVLWTAVLLLVLLFPLRTKVLLANPVLAWLGVLSYSIYILHQPVLHYTIRLWRVFLPTAGLGLSPLMVPWFVLAAASCLALAALTYRVIERPFLVRKARLDSTSARIGGDRDSPRTLADDRPPAAKVVR
jgi:peptidoglycan/LPS O-acetylase OafA/YrhL